MSASAVVARLRASKADYQVAEFNAGYSLGVEWAEQDASYSELRAVADLNESGDEVTPAVLAECVTCGDVHCVIQWINDVFGGDVTDDLAEGFVQGAASVWNSVECEL